MTPLPAGAPLMALLMAGPASAEQSFLALKGGAVTSLQELDVD